MESERKFHTARRVSFHLKMYEFRSARPRDTAARVVFLRNMLKRRLRRCDYDFQLENKEVKRLKERRRNKFNKLENEFCFVPAKAADFQRKAARLLKSEACARPVCKCWNTFSSSEKDLGNTLMSAA